MPEGFSTRKTSRKPARMSGQKYTVSHSGNQVEAFFLKGQGGDIGLTDKTAGPQKFPVQLGRFLHAGLRVVDALDHAAGRKLQHFRDGGAASASHIQDPHVFPPGSRGNPKERIGS